VHPGLAKDGAGMSRLASTRSICPRSSRNPVAGASGNQPRSSSDGLRSVTGCPRVDEGDEGRAATVIRKGWSFAAHVPSCGRHKARCSTAGSAGEYARRTRSRHTVD
jgi:hypothetical protein